MTSFLILIGFILGLIVIGTLFYLKMGQENHEEKADVEYTCKVCDDKDCVCHKENSEP